MIKAILSSLGQKKIQLVPESQEDEEILRGFASKLGIEEGEFSTESVNLNLIPPVIGGGKNLSRKKLHIIFQRH